MIRFLKQLVYGIFYLAVFAAAVFLIYLMFFKSPPPPVETPSIPEIPEATFAFAETVVHVEGEGIRVTGVLSNETPRIVPAIKIKATIFDKNGFELFSSETFQEDIRAYENRDFTVFFPETEDLARQVGKDFSPEISYVLGE